MKHLCTVEDGKPYIELYLPARTAVILKEGTIRKPKAAAAPVTEPAKKPAGKAAKKPAKKK